MKTKKGPGTLGPFENLTYNPPAKPSASDDLPLPREIFVHGNEKFLNALLDRLRHPGLDHFGIFAGISRGQRYLRRHDVGELRDRDRLAAGAAEIDAGAIPCRRSFSQRLRYLSSAGVDGGPSRPHSRPTHRQPTFVVLATEALRAAPEAKPHPRPKATAIFRAIHALVGIRSTFAVPHLAQSSEHPNTFTSFRRPHA